MGVTISYRGSIEDLTRIEDFEDRIIDLALELDAHAQIFRGVCDDDPTRVVRGVLLDLAPGQETTSLLISPEGWLVGLTQIEDAENGRLAESPWCFVKTQFGPVEGHVALVELLRELKRQFMPNLEVRDEGGYWESRDYNALRRSLGFVQAAIDGLAEALNQHELSSEAAEDPEIVVTHIERLAKKVHQTLARPAEHPPVHFADEDEWLGDDLGGSEAEWDEMYKENRRKQERIQRAIEERIGRGDETEEVFENALRDEGIIGLPEEPSITEDENEDQDQMLIDDEDEEDEPWKESLSDALDEEDTEGKHPLQQRSMDLMLRLHTVSEAMEDERSGHLGILHRGAGDMMGGLAQAMGRWGVDTDSGLALVQLKRALRGAAFARGALFPLRSEGFINDTVFDELFETIKALETDIHDELHIVRDQRRSD